ncbi:hypothetical protein H8957_006946, partial [Semnopithecus entellus]
MHIWTLSCAPAAQSWAPVTHWTDHTQPPLSTPLHSSRLPADYIILPTNLGCHCHRRPPHLINRLPLLVIWTHLRVIQTAGRPPRSLSPSARPISSHPQRPLVFLPH